MADHCLAAAYWRSCMLWAQLYALVKRNASAQAWVQHLGTLAPRTLVSFLPCSHAVRSHRGCGRGHHLPWAAAGPQVGSSSLLAWLPLRAGQNSKGAPAAWCCKHSQGGISTPGVCGTYRVIEALVKLAEEAGCYKIILDCSEENVPFYEKCGLYKKEVQMVSESTAAGLQQARFSQCKRMPRWQARLATCGIALPAALPPMPH